MSVIPNKTITPLEALSAADAAIWSEIHPHIAICARDGRKEMVVYSELTDVMIRQLRTEGYNVRSHDTYNGKYVISWGEVATQTYPTSQVAYRYTQGLRS